MLAQEYKKGKQIQVCTSCNRGNLESFIIFQYN